MLSVSAHCPLLLSGLLGTIPPATAIANMPTISHGGTSVSGASSFAQSLATLPALLASVSSALPVIGVGSSGVSGKQDSAVVLSSALPPITAKLYSSKDCVGGNLLP